VVLSDGSQHDALDLARMAVNDWEALLIAPGASRALKTGLDTRLLLDALFVEFICVRSRARLAQHDRVSELSLPQQATASFF
jgi:hypothetical protein